MVLDLITFAMNRQHYFKKFLLMVIVALEKVLMRKHTIYTVPLFPIEIILDNNVY